MALKRILECAMTLDLAVGGIFCFPFTLAVKMTLIPNRSEVLEVWMIMIGVFHLTGLTANYSDVCLIGVPAYFPSLQESKLQ